MRSRPTARVLCIFAMLLLGVLSRSALLLLDDPPELPIAARTAQTIQAYKAPPPAPPEASAMEADGPRPLPHDSSSDPFEEEVREIVEATRELFENAALADSTLAPHLRQLFLKQYGAMPVVPLAVPLLTYVDWTTQTGRTLFEDRQNALKRISIVNSFTPNPASDAGFQLVGFEYSEGLETLVGRRLGETRMSPFHLAQIVATSEGLRLQKMPEPRQEELIAFAKEWAVRRELARWKVWEMLQAPIRRPTNVVSGVASVFFENTGDQSTLKIARVGDDPHLDRLILDLEDLRADVFASVCRMLYE